MIFFLTQAASSHPSAEALHPEMLNWVRLLADFLSPSWVSDLLVRWEKAIFSFLIVLGIAGVSLSIVSRARLVPSRAQAALEGVVTALDGLVCGVLGPEGRRYTPFIGSLFIYIFVSNMFGLIPLQNSPMSFLTTTAPLALCVFLYVQWIGITRNGLWGYLDHMAGNPRDFLGFLLAPLNFPLHLMGEFIKPLSLSFRLYGNILSGHLLLGVFVMLGIAILRPFRLPFGVPLQFPFLFLEILVGTVQAFVFALLSTVYIAMMLPHRHPEEHPHEIQEVHPMKGAS